MRETLPIKYPTYGLLCFLVKVVILFILLLFLPLEGWSQSKQDHSLEGDMVYIPPGPFLFGTNKKDSAAEALSIGIPKPWYADETPQQKIFLKGYYIDRYEVTYKRYKKYIDDLGAVAPENWQGTDFPKNKDDDELPF